MSITMPSTTSITKSITQPFMRKQPGNHSFSRLSTATLLMFGCLAVAAASERPVDDAHAFGHIDDELGDVWINDVGALLDIDRDRDGWFSRFVISVDADVDRTYSHDRQFGSEARVYVRLSLTDSSGIESLLYDSADFDIYGLSSGDRHRIELDLRDAYPEDNYDMVIELRDAFDNLLLDVVDARDFRTLNGLPLEDAQRDGRIANDGHAGGGSRDDVVAVEYAGGSGPLFLLLGLAAISWRRRSSIYSRSFGKGWPAGIQRGTGIYEHYSNDVQATAQ